jgi:hypothetical protein
MVVRPWQLALSKKRESVATVSCATRVLLSMGPGAVVGSNQKIAPSSIVMPTTSVHSSKLIPIAPRAESEFPSVRDTVSQLSTSAPGTCGNSKGLTPPMCAPNGAACW